MIPLGKAWKWTMSEKRKENRSETEKDEREYVQRKRESEKRIHITKTENIFLSLRSIKSRRHIYHSESFPSLKVCTLCSNNCAI